MYTTGLVNMSSIICKCGKLKASTQKKICDDCRKENKRIKNMLDARKHRAKHGSEVKNRSLLCSMCKGVKEHQNRGYCLACERERYKNKSKPDCATCGAIKENPRDAYCKACKRNKAHQKSIEEGRRYKHDDGRNPNCTRCGKEKKGSYVLDSFCSSCKLYYKKLRKPYMTEEQKFKEAVRKLTNSKIRSGHLIRQPCEVCGTEEKIEAHHDDYMKPLDVRWLCKKHHQEHHRTVQKKDNKS